MKVIEFLDKSLSKYEVTQHRPTFTAQQMAAEEHMPGIAVAKPVIVKAGERFFMCVLPACCKIDLDRLRKHLKVRQMVLATEEEIAALFPDCQLGAEPPFGNLYGLDTIMDKTLEEDQYIAFQAGTHDKTIRMKTPEYKKLVCPSVASFAYHTC